MGGGLTWAIRPVVWFATASMLTTILHELAHASVAYARGVPSTLFNYLVDLDLTQAQAAGSDRALIAMAGPVFCLALGTAAAIAFRRARGSAAELPLLYFAVFGVATFFGNLISASFIGDFSIVAAALALPMGVRYTLSLTGAVAVAAVHFLAGRELIQFVPAGTSRMAGVLAIVALPVVAGTAAVILVNQPMPATFISIRAIEASFWLSAAIGAVVSPRHPGTARGSLALRWTDGVAALLAVLAVRLLVRGVPFTP